MTSSKVWLKAIRVPFFTATVIPIALGSIAAWHDTNSFMWIRFLWVLIGGLLIHAATNLANDYFDYLSGCDTANLTPTPFSGGSRVLPEGLLSPKKILYASLAAFALGSLIGLYLNYLSGKNIVLILGIIGVFLAFFYTAKPLRIGYTGFGELAVGVGFGPLMVMGAYYVQAQSLPFQVFLISIPVGILIALVLYINEFPDYTGDKMVGKNNLVVILGKKRAVILYHILLLTTYLVIVSLVLSKIVPVFCLVTLLSLPLALKAFITAKNNFDKIYELLPANAATIGLHSLIGILLCAGFLLDKILMRT